MKIDSLYSTGELPQLGDVIKFDLKAIYEFPTYKSGHIVVDNNVLFLKHMSFEWPLKRQIHVTEITENSNGEVFIRLPDQDFSLWSSIFRLIQRAPK